MEHDTPLEETDIPCTAFEILTSHGYVTVGDARDASDEELLAIPGIGHTRLRQIREAVRLAVRH